MRFLALTSMLVLLSCGVRHTVSGDTDHNVEGDIGVKAEFEPCMLYDGKPKQIECVERVFRILEAKYKCEKEDAT